MIVQSLPPKLMTGRTCWVHSLGCVEFELELGFGVSARRSVLIEGIEPRTIPEKMRSEAKHCLVTLLGGKRVLVLADVRKPDMTVLGRVFLNEKVHGNPEGMAQPPSLEEYLLEVGTFFNWLGSTKYDIQVVKAVLNGTGPKRELARGTA